MNTEKFWIRPKNPVTLKLPKKSSIKRPDPDNYNPRELSRYYESIEASTIKEAESMFGLKWPHKSRREPRLNYKSRDQESEFAILILMILVAVVSSPIWITFLLVRWIYREITKEERERKQKEFEDFVRGRIENQIRIKKIQLINEEIENEYREKVYEAKKLHSQFCESLRSIYDKAREALIEILNQHRKIVRGLNNYTQIEADLEEIKQLFSENRYAEFWEKSDALIKKIILNKERMAEIVEIQARFRVITEEILRDCEHNFPYPHTPQINWYKLRTVVMQFRSIVRKAETIYEFASIYQMILARREIKNGFRSVGRRMDKMADEIQETVYGLGQSILLEISMVKNKIQENTTELRLAVDAIEHQGGVMRDLEINSHEDNARLLEFIQLSEEERKEESGKLQKEIEKQTEILDDIRNKKSK